MKCHAIEWTHTSRYLLNINLANLRSLRGKQVVPKAFQINKVVLPGHKTGQGTDPQMMAGGAGGRPLTTNNSHQNKWKANHKNGEQPLTAQNELRNPNLGDTGKQLWTLFARKTLEQLEPNTEARVTEREKRKTPTLTPTGSSKDHTNTGGKNKGKGKGKNN